MYASATMTLSNGSRVKTSIIAKSSSSGFTWEGETSPVDAMLFAVSFTDTLHGTAVGGNGAIIRTVDGGKNWIVDTSGTTQILHALSFINENSGLAVHANAITQALRIVTPAIVTNENAYSVIITGNRCDTPFSFIDSIV